MFTIKRYFHPNSEHKETGTQKLNNLPQHHTPNKFWYWSQSCSPRAVPFTSVPQSWVFSPEHVSGPTQRHPAFCFYSVLHSVGVVWSPDFEFPVLKPSLMRSSCSIYVCIGGYQGLEVLTFFTEVSSKEVCIGQIVWRQVESPCLSQVVGVTPRHHRGNGIFLTARELPLCLATKGQPHTFSFKNYFIFKNFY